jgi:hypothetical protein
MCLLTRASASEQVCEQVSAGRVPSLRSPPRGCLGSRKIAAIAQQLRQQRRPQAVAQIVCTTKPLLSGSPITFAPQRPAAPRSEPSFARQVQLTVALTP